MHMHLLTVSVPVSAVCSLKQGAQNVHSGLDTTYVDLEMFDGNWPYAVSILTGGSKCVYRSRKGAERYDGSSA